MESLTIRPSREADIPAITAIYAVHVEEGTASFETVPPNESAMLQRRRLLIDGGFPFLVAAIDSGVCGYAYAGPYRTRSAYRNTVESTVYVRDSAQRRGVGKALLRALVEECTNQGFRQMIAVIGDAANVASIRLHRSAGFDYIGTLKDVGYKHDRWLSTVIMQRELSQDETVLSKE